MQLIAWWPNLAVLLLASAIDVYARRVPNWLVIPFLLSGLAVSGVSGGISGIGTSLAGIGLATLLFGIPCFLGGMGMGDLKLAAGIGAWIGPGQLFIAFVVTSIVGAALAMGYAWWHGALGESLDRTASLIEGREKSDHRKGLSIPYVPAMAIGTLFSFFAK
jgi:prepilin peptidase CpaA